MKRFLIIIFIAFLGFGCSTQKAAKKEQRELISKVYHSIALEALESRKFVIEGYEFFFPEGKMIQKSRGGYISLDGTKGVYQFTKDVFPRTHWQYISFTDNDAVFERMKPLQEGDMRFSLRIDSKERAKTFQVNYPREMHITLYSDTNKCLVEVFNAKNMLMIFSFNGYLYPLED